MNLAGRFAPRLVINLRAYDRRTAAADVAAGITVGLVALPLAMAFSIASGLSPQAGIYCAIVTGFLVSALGGSRVQIAGPTGAFVVVVAGIVARYGVDGLFMCTMMAGVMMVVMGLTGMGAAVRFIPRSVVVGFTNGIAVLIASTQLRDFFGIDLKDVPGEFGPRMAALAAHARSSRWRSSWRSSGGSLAYRDRSWRCALSRPRYTCCDCRSRRSDRDSAASRAACRTSRSRRFGCRSFPRC